MDSTAKTRDLFLKCIAAVYMFAFGSIYVQIPGLFGRNGILPVDILLQTIKEESKLKTTQTLFMNTPTLLWFLPINPDIGLEVLSLVGIALSFLCLIWRQVRVWPTFFLLWLLYMSIYKVGETFLWFQWDILLLEVGSITILVAPVSNKKTDCVSAANIDRQIPFYLVRWLLFRLMFASGVVKFTSQCPTWWGLTALNYHYESQCIPTPLAWWAHQLPDYIQQLSVIGTYIIEIGLPFFFFLPLRIPRLLAGYGQVFLMIAIYLSGNYNFFNILTVVLCLSLIDDHHLEYLKYCLTFGFFRLIPPPVDLRPKQSRSVTLTKLFFNLLTFSSFFYVIFLSFGYDGKNFRLKFSISNLQDFLTEVMPYIIWMSVIGFAATTLQVLYRSVSIGKLRFRKRLYRIFKSAIIFCPSAYLLTISMVRFSDVHPPYKSNLWPIAERWHQSSMKFDLVHSYGLFRRMTGVEGRPEVVIEGSFSDTKGWKEYHFVYKPGDVKSALTWAAPHQPRLDWQMWFAALGSYQHNPWIISLMHRLMSGQKEVLNLLDPSRNPFPDQPPVYMRAQLYHYHYTNLKKDLSVPKAVWKRQFRKSYVPTITKDSKQVVDFLKYNKLMPKPLPKRLPKPSNAELLTKQIRSLMERISPPLLLWSLALTAILISLTSSYLRADDK